VDGGRLMQHAADVAGFEGRCHRVMLSLTGADVGRPGLSVG
jgi:hypothetical protein